MRVMNVQFSTERVVESRADLLEAVCVVDEDERAICGDGGVQSVCWVCWNICVANGPRTFFFFLWKVSILVDCVDEEDGKEQTFEEL